MSTPGIRRALHALARAKRANVARVARGQRPHLRGKPVSLGHFNRVTGAHLSKRTARARQAARRRR